ncbi:hypothetical protein I350_04172 [Cryptococcus amylolentus CBS 6273]|uniref:NAA35-like N-terminal domain-containing protein n=1 Tax=Cryptococcus amylolentus CBS 6273 TaxID=1296118 RepID=A0A1E3K3N5_9TREE|nr:hypothetical protein I350_04172 [Cryptococcus amylolentus CBS 6273]
MQDITSWLTQQCDELPYGELAKPSSFSMMDAMKGLQMMDSKMDTGTRDKLQSTQLFDPNANISAEDLCFIMDRMLALEVSWYRGGNLCQSVYSCLYFHNLYMIEAPSDPLATGNLLTKLVLRAYILLFCKSIDFAYTEFAKGNVYEGEDCWLDHYGVPLRVSEDTDTVVAVADDALGWLESEECQLPVFLKNQLVYRLVFRRNFLQYIDASTLSASPTRQILLVMKLAAEEIKPCESLSDTVGSAFDKDMSSYLRQSMPLPDFRQLDFDQSWGEMKSMVRDLLRVETLLASGGWDQWSTRFTMLCDERADSGVYKSDILATEGLAQESADTNQVQVVLKSVTHNTSFSSQAQSLKVWKVLLLKDVLTTLAIASQNGPRQRRSLIDLSHQLRERATMAEYQAFPHISQTIHLLRLDCMLDAALGALDLELVHPADEREAWWWIRTVAKARIRGGTESSTIRARWAEAWESIGAGMEILLTAIPLSSLPISNSTQKARFALKYKHYSKAIYMPDGTKRSVGVVPAYEDWIRSQDEMDNNPTFRDVFVAKPLLEQAWEILESLDSVDLPDAATSDLKAIIGCLQAALLSNIQTIEQKPTRLRWRRHSREPDSIGRWILLLE